MSARPRPDPLRWVWYQYGGRLPARFRPWVLHDATAPTWLARAALRSLMRLVPPVVAVVLVLRLAFDGPWVPVLGAAGLGLLVGLRYAVSNLEESVDARLVTHGYPRGYGLEVRRAARREQDEAARHRYEQRWRHPAP